MQTNYEHFESDSGVDKMGHGAVLDKTNKTKNTEIHLPVQKDPKGSTKVQTYFSGSRRSQRFKKKTCSKSPTVQQTPQSSITMTFHQCFKKDFNCLLCSSNSGPMFSFRVTTAGNPCSLTCAGSSWHMKRVAKLAASSATEGVEKLVGKTKDEINYA